MVKEDRRINDGVEITNICSRCDTEYSGLACPDCADGEKARLQAAVNVRVPMPLDRVQRLELRAAEFEMIANTLSTLASNVLDYQVRANLLTQSHRFHASAEVWGSIASDLANGEEDSFWRQIAADIVNDRK